MKLQPGAAIAALPAPIQGAVWMTLSGVSFTISSAAVRHLASDIHFVEISFFRAVFGILVMLPWLTSVGLSAMKTRQTGKYIARGTVSVAANLCWFAALGLMPIADATSLSFATPIFITVAAVFFLRERMRAIRWVGLILGFAGTLVILRPGFAEVNTGALLVLGSCVLFACSGLFVKVLSRNERPDTIALYQLIYMLPINFIPSLFVWTWPTGEQWVWAVAVGVFTTLAQRAYVRAYAAADASAVQPFDFLRLPFAVLIGFLIFAEWPDPWAVTGGIVIFASSVYVAHGEARANRRR